MIAAGGLGFTIGPALVVGVADISVAARSQSRRGAIKHACVDTMWSQWLR